MDEKVVIRPARPGDEGGIARVHIQSWKETYPGIVPASFIAGLSVAEREEAWGKRLREIPADGRFTFVSESSGEIGGFASGGAFRLGEGVDPALAKRYDGEFMAIYLLRSQQRRGTGKALFREICAGLKERNFKSMLVWVLKKNPACGFYEKMGGVKAAEMKIKIGETLDELGYGWNRIP